ncbi:Speckle-type POZ protein-like B [Tetrabaena socialis]|uniref:Speckle-type POZ protein-like B n=1 Tax=Tetrabaena socialis TaxID=47790 RepID=A0A2J7ZLK6_9CHLO|nr:Speckle-type POZ protein-like B [Tetrabaena socialis]|eukprot:PNH01151.1 Speckle-type POZ protein-like B [Tetrabaena socialis]
MDFAWGQIKLDDSTKELKTVTLHGQHGISVGPIVMVMQRSPDGILDEYLRPGEELGLYATAYDPRQGCVWLCDAQLKRLDDNGNEVAPVAGRGVVQPGALLATDTFVPRGAVPGEAGVLYLTTQAGGLIKLYLPVPGLRGAATPVAVLASGVVAAAFDHGTQQLFVASRTAVFRVSGSERTLLAGSEPSGGAAAVRLPARDGQGVFVSFTCIEAMVVDAEGCLYVADAPYDGMGARDVALRRVSPDGAVSTVLRDAVRCSSSTDLTAPTGPTGALQMALLPHGWLAMFGRGYCSLQLFQLGLRPSAPGCAAAAAAAASTVPLHAARRGGLADDLGALIPSQQQHGPSATSDVTVRVGGTDFPAHRTILSARCPYFERHFASRLGEASRGPIVELPDADPATFRHIWSYIYTGDAGRWTDLDTAQRVAELADRLMMRGLCEEALRRMVAGLEPGTLVPMLVWAERMEGSMGFCGLLCDLEAWYLQHEPQVLEVAGAKEALRARRSLVGRLMSAGSDAMMEVVMEELNAEREADLEEERFLADLEQEGVPEWSDGGRERWAECMAELEANGFAEEVGPEVWAGLNAGLSGCAAAVELSEPAAKRART